MILSNLKITASDLVLYIGLLLTVLNIIDKSSILKQKAESPHKELIKRVETVEDENKNLKDEIKDLKAELDKYKDGVKVLLTSMRELLSHNIDGNNLEGMIEARNELNTYLVNK